MPAAPAALCRIAQGLEQCCGTHEIAPTRRLAGRRLVILPAFDPQAWLDAVEREGVTHAFVVPTMLKRIMEVDDFEKYNLDTLQLITYGAAPMPYEVVRRRR